MRILGMRPGKESRKLSQVSGFSMGTHYDPKEAIWTKQAFDMWKELGKTGMTFWGGRKELEEILRRAENELKPE